jgi:hypothetical protein
MAHLRPHALLNRILTRLLFLLQLATSFNNLVSEMVWGVPFSVPWSEAGRDRITPTIRQEISNKRWRSEKNKTKFKLVVKIRCCLGVLIASMLSPVLTQFASTNLAVLDFKRPFTRCFADTKIRQDFTSIFQIYQLVKTSDPSIFRNQPFIKVDGLFEDGRSRNFLLLHL